MRKKRDFLSKHNNCHNSNGVEVILHFNIQISKQRATELDSAREQVLQLQGILKDKEKNEQQLQLKVKELKESFDQKKKQNEIQQAELKTALLEKVNSYTCNLSVTLYSILLLHNNFMHIIIT